MNRNFDLLDFDMNLILIVILVTCTVACLPCFDFGMDVRSPGVVEVNKVVNLVDRSAPSGTGKEGKENQQLSLLHAALNSLLCSSSTYAEPCSLFC